MHESKFDRRQLLKGALLGAVAVPALRPQDTQAGEMPKLAETDPTAKALGYHIDAKKVDVKAFPTYKATQICGNCVQLQPGSGDYRGCNLFPGKSVAVNGWCKVWVQKP